jgi:hypothetical protein
MNSTRRLIEGISALFLVCLTLTGCPPTVTSVLSPEAFMTQLRDAGYIPLKFPDSKFEPGSVVVAEKDGLRWIGHLRDCGVPPEAMKVTIGTTGDVKFNQSAKVNAAAVLAVKGITAGPSWNMVRTAVFTQQGLGSDAVDQISLRLWLAEPANATKAVAACEGILREPETYLVGESMRVNSGKYTLSGSNGAAIKITGLQAGPVSISPSADATVSADGELVLSTKVYTGVRKLKRTGTGFQNLGGPAQGYDDEKVRSLITPPKA